MADHVALVQQDSRGRLSLAKWLDRDTEYKVFPMADGSLMLVPREVRAL